MAVGNGGRKRGGSWNGSLPVDLAGEVVQNQISRRVFEKREDGS
jgi:hypothetical protein